jgi:hypothetical protein
MQVTACPPMRTPSSSIAESFHGVGLPEIRRYAAAAAHRIFGNTVRRRANVALFSDKSGLDRRVSAPDGRVSRKRQFLPRGEDPQPIIGARGLRLQQESRLGRLVQALGVDHHRRGIAEERLVGKDVDLLEGKIRHDDGQSSCITRSARFG